MAYEAVNLCAANCTAFKGEAFAFLRDNEPDASDAPFLLAIFNPDSGHYHRLELGCERDALWHDLAELKGLRTLLDQVIAAEEARHGS